MANPYFSFKQFTVFHDQCAMKVTTDACLFGAWCAAQLQKENKKFHHLLDIGTGTGLLSMMVAQKLDTTIDAVEIDEKGAEQAKENVTSSPWKNSIHVIHGNVFKILLKPQYDVIISNPPFYENELQSGSKERNIAHHSEELQLHHLFAFIQQKLTHNGSFFLLLPYKRQAEINTLLNKCKLYLHHQVAVHQSPKHAPFRLLLQGGKYEAGEPKNNTLVIAEKDGNYTPEFTQLLKDYYLYL